MFHPWWKTRSQVKVQEPSVVTTAYKSLLLKPKQANKQTNPQNQTHQT